MIRLTLLAVALLAAPAALGQTLPTGTWTGTLGTGRSATPVAADLGRCADGLTLALALGPAAPVDAQAVRLDGARLGFRFVEPGARRTLACALVRQPDGSFAGSCAADRRPRRTLTLRPPAAAAFGCAE